MEGQRDIEKENLGGNVSRRKQGARSVGGSGNIIRPISEMSESLDLIACAASKTLEVEGDLVSQPTGSAAHHDDVAAGAGPARAQSGEATAGLAYRARLAVRY